jgi:2'-5' RNA ligase superfamily protein
LLAGRITRNQRGQTLVENQFRFGVFLRPDPKTCAAVTQITGQLRAQYGLISAGAFPPHVTLAGSLPVVVPLAELIQLIGFVLRRTPAFTVQNLGIRRLGDSALAYDVSTLDGAPNRTFSDLAGAVDSVVRPLLGPSGSLPPDLYEPDRWMPHISLVSHELRIRADLRDEVEDYVNGLGVMPPASFTADTVTLYRFAHNTWTGSWWRDIRWEHVRSWRLSKRMFS